MTDKLKAEREAFEAWYARSGIENDDTSAKTAARIAWQARAKLDRTHIASPDVVRDADSVSSDELCRLLPGPYYMDPPDGGDLPLVEQLKRMAIDAARYRWLRNEAIHYENQDTRTPWVFNAKNVADYDGWPVWDQELDKLVDAAMAAKEGGE